MHFAAKNRTNPAVIDATGYAPYIKARAKRADASGKGALPANRRAQAICDYWQRSKSARDMEDYYRQYKADMSRGQWECEADRKALYSRVRWEMDKVTSEMDKNLDQRRARLAELLKSEEEQNLEELNKGKKEGHGVKKESMIQRYAELKMLKEKERNAIVQEKKEQQFKRNCDELRLLVSQKIQQETAREGRKINLEKEQEKQERNKEDEMYAELWAQDREAKELRDSREAEEKRRRGIKNQKFVQDQILEKKLERMKKQREKEHDAAVVEEHKHLAALEEECEKEKRKQRKEDLKQGLDACAREKLKERIQEVQQDLHQDLYFMKRISESEEEARRNEKKRALMQEQKDYLKCLEDQIKAEAEFEKEVDRMYQEEVEKKWQKKEKEWEEEKCKRRQRVKDVLNEVQKQIESNLDKGRETQALSQMYAQKVIEKDAEDRRRAKENLQLIRDRNADHQKELLDQIRKREEKIREEKLQKDMELEAIRRKRIEEEERIQHLLAEVKINDEHPYRVRSKQIC